MPQTSTSSEHAATAALLLVLATLLLSACGSSSASTSSTVRSGTATSSGVQRGVRITAFRECLRKNGIAMPKPSGGAPRAGGGFPGAGGAPTLPAGVNQAQYQAAVKKCGGLPGIARPGARNLTSPQFTQALAKFAACMRANGVNVPAPNTSGKGPVFDAKGLNPASPKFAAARKKCSPLLLKAFKIQPGSGVSPGAQPPAG